jgi:hypothetical protein
MTFNDKAYRAATIGYWALVKKIAREKHLSKGKVIESLATKGPYYVFEPSPSDFYDDAPIDSEEADFIFT